MVNFVAFVYLVGSNCMVLKFDYVLLLHNYGDRKKHRVNWETQYRKIVEEPSRRVLGSPIQGSEQTGFRVWTFVGSPETQQGR